MCCRSSSIKGGGWQAEKPAKPRPTRGSRSSSGDGAAADPEEVKVRCSLQQGLWTRVDQS